jgi:hypothetical protein
MTPHDRRQRPITDSQLQANLWIGEMLRRYHAKQPDGLARFRSVKAWLKIVEWQVAPGEHINEYLDCQLTAFLQAGMPRGGPPWYSLSGPNKLGSENPWSIQCRPGGRGEQSINRVPSAAQDLEFARDTREREEVESERNRQKERQRSDELHRAWLSSPIGKRYLESERKKKAEQAARLANPRPTLSFHYCEADGCLLCNSYPQDAG